MNDANMRGISREWLAARIVVIGGFLIAIAVVAYFTLRPTPQPVAESQPAAPVPQQMTTAEQKANANARDGMMVCAMELVNAKNSGIVPAYGQLASMLPSATAVRGRYVCNAATPAAKYAIAADLLCRNLQDPRCVLLYQIATGKGTVLYRRQH
jgi:hypothetical protein